MPVCQVSKIDDSLNLSLEMKPLKNSELNDLDVIRDLIELKKPQNDFEKLKEEIQMEKEKLQNEKLLFLREKEEWENAKMSR